MGMPSTSIVVLVVFVIVLTYCREVRQRATDIRQGDGPILRSGEAIKMVKPWTMRLGMGGYGWLKMGARHPVICE